MSRQQPAAVLRNHAHDLLAGVLEDEGFDVERGAGDMDTAFVASAGSGDGPTTSAR